MILKLHFLLLVPCFVQAQTTLIPDARFERALMELGIDTDQTINGQIATQDALAVTSLEISQISLPNYPYITPGSDYYDGLIHDFTGLEAFVNIEQLNISYTMAEEINLNNLVHLKHLIFGDNMLTNVDFSNNPLLETVEINNGGELLPVNYISALDLSHNPNINFIKAGPVPQINLNNLNNLENMQINLGCTSCWGPPDNYSTVCIQVDNPTAASDNQFPYNTWTIHNWYTSVHFTNDAALCVLGNETFKAQKISLSPNPTRGILQLETSDDITEIKLYDLAGRINFERKNPGNVLNLQDLSTGVYLLEATTKKGVLSQKLIKE